MLIYSLVLESLDNYFTIYMLVKKQIYLAKPGLRNLIKKLKNVVSLVQKKFKSDGGLSSISELKKMYAQSGLDVSPNIDTFNMLDTNKNGILEESEIDINKMV